MWIFFTLVLQWFPRHKAYRSGSSLVSTFRLMTMFWKFRLHVLLFSFSFLSCLQVGFPEDKDYFVETFACCCSHRKEREQDVDSGLSSQIRIGPHYQLSVVLGKRNSLKPNENSPQNSSITGRCIQNHGQGGSRWDGCANSVL